MKKNKQTNCFFPIYCLLLLLSILYSAGNVYAVPVKKEILIGTHLPLTGIMAAMGKEQKWAYEAAVADINKSGGIYVMEYKKKLPVRLVVLDDTSDPSVVVISVEKLIKTEKVDLLLSGHAAAYGVIPGCIVAEINQIYYHATACFIPCWLAHHFSWSTLFFYDMEQTVSMPFEIWKSLPEKKRPRRTALIMEDTYDAMAFDSLFKKKANDYQYQFTLDLSLPVGDKDFSSQIIKAQEMGVDAIILFASLPDTISFLTQMKEHDFSVNYLQGWKGMWPAEFGKILGESAENLLCDAHWSETYPYSGAKELGERFYKEFGFGSVSIGMFYALAQILWQAIEKAGTLNSAVVRTTVLHNEFKTVMGKINYDLKGVARYPSLTCQWENGRQEIIYPFKFATRKLRLPHE